MVTVFDADGQPLTDATAQVEHRSRVILVDVESPGVLLQYYFGRGERRVMIELGATLVDGSIETRWRGTGRAWWVDLETPTGRARIPAAAPDLAESAARSSGAPRTGRGRVAVVQQAAEDVGIEAALGSGSPAGAASGAPGRGLLRSRMVTSVLGGQVSPRFLMRWLTA